MNKIARIGIVFFTILQTACMPTRTLEQASSAPPEKLQGKYNILRMEQQEFNNQTNATALIELDEAGRGAAYLGCNRIFFQWQSTAEKTLRFNAISSTRMACPTDNAEQDFIRLLSQVDHYQIKKQALLLQHGESILIHLERERTQP